MMPPDLCVFRVMLLMKCDRCAALVKTARRILRCLPACQKVLDMKLPSLKSGSSKASKHHEVATADIPESSSMCARVMPNDLVLPSGRSTSNRPALHKHMSSLMFFIQACQECCNLVKQLDILSKAHLIVYCNVCDHMPQLQLTLQTAVCTASDQSRGKS